MAVAQAHILPEASGAIVRTASTPGQDGVPVPAQYAGEQPDVAGRRAPQRTHSVPDRARQGVPRPATRRTAAPKHELLHRLKRLSRFLCNERVDPVAIQVAFLPDVLAPLGNLRQLGLVVDWTSWDTKLLGLVGGGSRP